MSEELVVLENLNAVEVFVAGGTDKLLQAIRDEVINDIPDITTAKGRSEIASRAHKVAKSKVAIDKLGKELADKLNAQLKPINAERKKSKDALEALKIEVREPLTNWEDEEAARVNGLKLRLSHFPILASAEKEEFPMDVKTCKELKESLIHVESIVVDESFEEFEEEAKTAKIEAIEALKKTIEIVGKKEEEAAELERLQKAEADRIQKEREEKIAKDAAAAAEAGRLAAEAREKQGIEDAKARLEAAELKAAEDQKQAIIKAEEDKQAAIEVERQRVAAEAQDKIDEEKKREANTEHKRNIHNAILIGLRALDIDDVLGKKIIVAIAKGKIENVNINY